ncbi:MAG TPA: tyrosine-type recombinase/integrase [Segeticoccus sp.]|nr:tyrosine-type recombinase/integrase [Segeticoccus sp.]
MSPRFRFHDLRHYFAGLLIASGLDVKVVQSRLRHASAMTTLNTDGHLWPDTDETSRAAVAALLRPREAPVRHERGGDRPLTCGRVYRSKYISNS